MLNPLDIIIVEKTGVLKSLSIKDFKEDELFKKCGFKKQEQFIKHTEWNIKEKGIQYTILVYGKTDGRANSENKYDFPPPIDNTLFFGNCAIIAKNKNNFINLSLDLWQKIYEKLFGGFENLALCAIEDEDEEHEVANIQKNKKTKIGGYLKDGFVVDGSDNSEDEEEEEEEESEDNEICKNNDESDEIIEENIGSELSEESYDYSSDEK